MSYEYKDEIIKQIPNMYDVWSSDGVEKRQKELSEVYRKAKAFDEILRLPTSFNCLEHSDAVDEVIYNYKSEEDNK